MRENFSLRKKGNNFLEYKPDKTLIKPINIVKINLCNFVIQLINKEENTHPDVIGSDFSFAKLFF